jgi:uncharacterized membrane protein
MHVSYNIATCLLDPRNKIIRTNAVQSVIAFDTDQCLCIWFFKSFLAKWIRLLIVPKGSPSISAIS